MKGITQISYRQDTHQHHSCKWSVMLPSRSATENVKTREPWFLFDKVSLPKWHWISWNYRKWNNLGWIHVASVTAWTQMYKHAHTVEKEGANLPSTLIIHHMITSHPKHACVFIKTHLDPDSQAYLTTALLSYFVDFYLYAMAFSLQTVQIWWIIVTCMKACDHMYICNTLWSKNASHSTHCLKGMAKIWKKLLY